MRLSNARVCTHFATQTAPKVPIDSTPPSRQGEPMQYALGALVLGGGFLLVAVIALHATPGETPASKTPTWARSRWLTIPATALFLGSLIWYGLSVLFG